MRRVRLRNAFFRGWFAARADRPRPAPEGWDDVAYVEHGFKAGVASGGRALPLIGNHRPPPLPDPEPPAALAAPEAEPAPNATVDLDLTHLRDSDEDIPTLTERAEPDEGPVLKRKPPSRSRFWDD